jgi:hypothetical protein
MLERHPGRTKQETEPLWQVHQEAGLRRGGHTQVFNLPKMWRHTQAWLVVCYFCPVELQLTLIRVRILRWKRFPSDR